MREYPSTKQLQRVTIEGYEGLWGEISRVLHNDHLYVLLEHNYWGDETCYLAVCVPPVDELEYVFPQYKDPVYLKENTVVDETYDGLLQCLYDCDIINEEEFEKYSEEEEREEEYEYDD